MSLSGAAVQAGMSRIVLCPQGLPQNADARERALGLLLACGADLGRIVENGKRSVELFADHVAAIRNVRDGSEPVLVVLSRVTPARELAEIRRVLEARIPALETAPWVLVADPETEPTAIEELSAIGRLDGAIWDAPRWRGPDGLRYLVLSPHLSQLARTTLRDRIAQEGAPPPQKSTFRNLRIPNAHERPTIRVPALTDTRPTVPAPKQKIA